MFYTNVLLGGGGKSRIKPPIIVLTRLVLRGRILRVAGRSPRAVREPPQPHPQVVRVPHCVIRHPIIGQVSGEL